MGIESIREVIDANIRQNGNQGITGEILNNVLNEMVEGLSEEIEGNANAIQTLESQIPTLESQIAEKQDALVSGQNIKTLNGEPLLGEGDIVISDEELRAVVENQGNKLTELSAEINTIKEIRIPYSGNSYVDNKLPFSLTSGMVVTDIGAVTAIFIRPINVQSYTTVSKSMLPYTLTQDIDIFQTNMNAEGELTILGAFRYAVKEDKESLEERIEQKANIPCIFEYNEQLKTKKAVYGIKDMAIEAQDGWIYTIVLKNLSTSSQFSLYRAEKASPKALKYCGNFCPTITSMRNGVVRYDVVFGTGEKAAVIIDWDSIAGLEASSMYPDEFILKEEIFKGGLLSNNLMPQVSEVTKKVDVLDAKVDGLSASGGTPQDIYWAVCGDSITNANHATIYDIAEGDQYMPIDGYPNLNTYKRKNYAYYIAQRNRLKWANYGWGGTTLSSVTSKAYGYKNAFVDDRMTSMADVEWDYISLFFGGNDSYYGPTAHKDKWLKEKYGQDIGYPINAEQIGANGFANAEQKAACDAVVGVVNGVDYQSNADYFIAKFIGSISDTSKDTWYGALNTAVSYLLTNHPKAKIILVASYTPESPKYADAVVAVAKKYGVRYFDFRDVPHWPVSANGNWQVLNNPSRADGKWPSESGLMYSATIFGRNQALYIYDSAHPTNKGYEEMSHLLEQTIIA